MAADGVDQPAQPFDDLGPFWPTRRTQHRGEHPAVAVEHHNRLRSVFVVVCVEQAELLRAVSGIEGIVDIQHNPVGYGAEIRAIMLDHRQAHAQQRARPGQILGA